MPCSLEGVAALILGQSPSLTPNEVMAKILADASSGRVSNKGVLSPNLLLFTDM